MGEWEPQRVAIEESFRLKLRGEDGWGPEPPSPRAGDRYVIIGAAAGMIAGGVAGFLLNFVMALVGVVAGGVLGALAGSFLRSFVTRRKRAHAKGS